MQVSVTPTSGVVGDVKSIDIRALVPAGLLGDDADPFEVQSVSFILKSGEASCWYDCHSHLGNFHCHQICYP